MDYRTAGNKVLSKEIEALTRLRKHINNDFDEVCNIITQTKGKIIFTGIGKSGHVAKKCASTFSSLGISSTFVHSTEALHGDLGLISNGDTLIALSFSGETVEVIRMISALKSQNISVVSMTGKPESTLAKKSDIHLNIHVKEEADPLGCAPTASTINMMALGDAIGAAVSHKNQFTHKDFHQFHPGGSLGERLEDS